MRRRARRRYLAERSEACLTPPLVSRRFPSLSFVTRPSARPHGSLWATSHTLVLSACDVTPRLAIPGVFPALDLRPLRVLTHPQISKIPHTCVVNSKTPQASQMVRQSPWPLICPQVKPTTTLTNRREGGGGQTHSPNALTHTLWMQSA